MTKSMKTLVGSISVAVIVLVIAAFTTPKTIPPQIVVNGDASLSLTSQFGGTVELGQRQNISWKSTNYSPKTVVINVIRKTGDNPARYELIRNISVATLNDGSAVWVPALTDLGNNIYIEVGCAISDQACTASQSTHSLAVIDTGRYSNTAAVYQSIESIENK